MGASNTRVKMNHPSLDQIDYDFFTKQTGLDKEDIDEIFEKYTKNTNEAVEIDRKAFMQLYAKLRPEPEQRLREISEHIFRTFDQDRNGTINFVEFIIAYAITSRGDLKERLDYAFNMYDRDANGYLNEDEVENVLYGMLDLLGTKSINVPGLTEECLKTLDKTKDHKISRDEFVAGLLQNERLRTLMSPFN